MNKIKDLSKQFCGEVKNSKLCLTKKWKRFNRKNIVFVSFRLCLQVQTKNSRKY